MYSRYGNRAAYVISESYADAVGAFVRWLVEESGWKVTEPGRPDKLVNLRYRHVCILSRRLQSQYAEVMRPYTQALEAREIPHVLVGGKGFHDREEVLALRNVLQAIEWPDDALSVYATLKGPFLAFTDGALLTFRSRYGSFHPFGFARGWDAREGVPEEERELAEVLSTLADLHRNRNHRPIAETISRFLSSVRAHAGLANWRAGEQVLANCLRVVERARAFESDGGTSFRAFVELLEDEADRGEGEEAPIVEEGTEGVRIMTVHRAKGLEFPVVILADPTYGATHSRPSRYIDPERKLWAEPLCGALPLEVLENRDAEAAHDQAEAVRLAYVAATRARDLLVLPVVGEGEELSGWAEFLNPGAYPGIGTRRSPLLGGMAVPGCPAFGEQTILDSPRRSGPAPEGPAEVAVKPGLHTSQAGTPIVWWDPAVLELDVAPATGLRKHDILAADDGDVASTAGLQAYREWRELRERVITVGARPEAMVVAARTRAGQRAHQPETLADSENAQTSAGLAAQSSGEFALPVEVRQLPRVGYERPGNSRFGELVHRTLAAVKLSASSAEIQSAANLQARILGAPPAESAAAAVAVERALTDSLLMPLVTRDPDVVVHREVPVILQEETDEITEGVVDLTYRERLAGGAGRWTVVEFKTDREVEGAVALYKEQVAIYSRAIAKATGEEVRGVLLVI
jgi:ATP-dependent exoDNAse (exonuclease V) beta subunit